MAEEILAIGTNMTPSGDVEVTDTLTVCLKGSGGAVNIQLKDDDSAYHTVDTLNTAHRAKVIAGPGTYRFVRTAGGKSVGVFSG